MKFDKDNGGRGSLEDKTRALFAESVAGTDGSTSSRLTRARHRALQELGTPSHGWQTRWLPAGAVAAAAAVLLVVMMGRLPDTTPGLTTEVATDLEILLDTDDLELIEELAFYAWLDEQPELQEVSGEDNGVG